MLGTSFTVALGFHLVLGLILQYIQENIGSTISFFKF